MSNHTPGPWIIDGVEIRAAASHESESICEMSPCFSHADANLIAAAPELLEALEYALSMWGDYLPPGNSNAMKAIKQSRAAIANAKGVKS